jgi:hypothetical protein
LRRRIQIAIAVGALAACATAFGAERITLSNGFTMDCNHHVTVDGHVRLYLNAGEDNYIEVRTEEIAGVESVPDPPGETITAPSGNTSEAKLSPTDLHEMLIEAGQEHNLDVDLLASVVKAESNGDVRAVSKAGARGLMQLMPATANDLGVTDSFKPGENVRGGSIYLDELLTRYHENLSLALAAYNAGPAAVDKYHGIPPYRETQLYVARVIHEFNRRVRAREAESSKPADAQVTSRAPASQ